MEIEKYMSIEVCETKVAVNTKMVGELIIILFAEVLVSLLVKD